MNRFYLCAALLGSAAAGASLAVVIAWASQPTEHRQTANSGLDPQQRFVERDAHLDGSRDHAAETLRLVDAVLAPVSASIPLDPWRTDADSVAEFAKQRIAAFARARDAAIAAFGPQARDFAAFRPIFYPLADRIPALPSTAQIAIHEAELASSISPEQGAARFASIVHAIETAAGADAAHEYALRQSPAARSLRASGLVLDENEYRQCFEALSVFESPALEPQRYLAARRKLRATLGSARFATLWSKRDPRYAELRKLAARYDVIAERIDSAYIVLNEMQDALLEQAGESGHDAVRLSELYAAQRRRLADILGEPTADAVLRDLAIWASDTQR